MKSAACTRLHPGDTNPRAVLIRQAHLQSPPHLNNGTADTALRFMRSARDSIFLLLPIKEESCCLPTIMTSWAPVLMIWRWWILWAPPSERCEDKVRNVTHTQMWSQTLFAFTVTFWNVRFFIYFERSIFCLPRLHLFDQKYSKICKLVEYYFHIK